MPRLPEGCSFERSKLELDEDGKIIRVFYDEKGIPIHAAKWSRINRRTGISVSQTEDPKLYARIYYRNVRRYRDKYKPRLPDIET